MSAIYNLRKMARSSRIGRGKVVVSCWTARACFLPYHPSLFGTEPWFLSTFSSCFALRRCFFMYLPLCLPSSEVPCFRRFFCSFSCCWCCCCFRCFCHCCICFLFFCTMSQVSVLEGWSLSTIYQGRLRPFPLLYFFICFFSLLFFLQRLSSHC